MADVVVRGGTVVNAEGAVQADVTIDHGRIVEVGTGAPSARESIDATGLHILPGIVDIHVHFNEPGRTSWEGAASGSRALAASGGTLFFDMPLNSAPCTIGPKDFDQKRAALESSSIADFSLWGGLVPGRVGDMAAMADRGVVGFKAFMCDSGLPEFPRADDDTLHRGLQEAARLNLPVAVHAESEEHMPALAQVAADGGARAFLDSRPVRREVEAIRRVLELAEEARARLHIVHVSSGAGVRMATEARRRGVDVSVETCPHYLFFTDQDVERRGVVLKCAPPLRAAAEQQALWQHLLDGHIDNVASDHSPTEPSMKNTEFARAWGGIAGVQSTLAVLLERGYHDRGLSLARIAALTSATPASRFRIARKGAIAVGYDADLVLIDLTASFRLDASDLLQRHKTSPYVGHVFRGRVRRTIRRGETIFADGSIVGQSRGRFVRPL